MILPGDTAEDWSVAAGAETAVGLGPWELAAAATKLPGGSYRLADGRPGDAALGWLLAHYKFTRYLSEKPQAEPRILLPNHVREHTAAGHDEQPMAAAQLDETRA